MEKLLEALKNYLVMHRQLLVTFTFIILYFTEW